MSSFRNRSSLIFFILAFAIAWPALFISTQQSSVPLQLLLFILGSYAPTIAAWSALAIEGNTEESRAFRHRLQNWRVRPWLYVPTVVIPILIWGLTLVFSSSQRDGAPIAWTSLFSFPLIFVINLGEEIGWRGFALPRMIVSSQPLTASLLLGLIWGAFHIPLYWQRPLFALVFLILTPALSIIITWLFLTAGESVFVATLFHAVFNSMSQVILPAQGGEMILAITAALMWLVAVSLIARYGFKLSRST